MKRALATALIVGLIGFAGSDTLDAQAKKTYGAVEISKGKEGMRWRVVGSEGKTIAMPLPNTHWDTKEEVLKAIDELKEVLKAKPIEVKDLANPPKSKTGSVEIYMGKGGMRYRIINAEYMTRRSARMPARNYETKEEVLKVIDELKERFKSKPIDVEGVAPLDERGRAFPLDQQLPDAAFRIPSGTFMCRPRKYRTANQLACTRFPDVSRFKSFALEINRRSPAKSAS